jgi:hypothetical protein
MTRTLAPIDKEVAMQRKEAARVRPEEVDRINACMKEAIARYGQKHPKVNQVFMDECAARPVESETMLTATGSAEPTAHQAARRIPFLVREDLVDVLEAREVTQLRKYGTLIQGLAERRLIATTQEQRHFVLVACGLAKPESFMEKTWDCYQTLARLTDKMLAEKAARMGRLRG